MPPNPPLVKGLQEGRREITPLDTRSLDGVKPGATALDTKSLDGLRALLNLWIMLLHALFFVM